MQWYIGCSGFSYKEWKDKFYPAGLPANQWFEYYANQFNTLEVNLTFYNFPRKAVLENWYRKCPADFRFAVKAPRSITHYKKFADAKELLNDFYKACSDGLQNKLGPVLFQLPPSFSFTEERLALIIESLSSNYKNVVEFRHDSWWDKKVYAALAEKDIVFSGVSHPSLPPGIVANSSVLYHRFHGVPKLYYSGYSEKELIQFADAVLKQQHIKEVYCYFNNTASMEAIRNVQEITGYLSSVIHQK